MTQGTVECGLFTLWDQCGRPQLPPAGRAEMGCSWRDGSVGKLGDPSLDPLRSHDSLLGGVSVTQPWGVGQAPGVRPSASPAESMSCSFSENKGDRNREEKVILRRGTPMGTLLCTCTHTHALTHVHE